MFRSSPKNGPGLIDNLRYNQTLRKKIYLALAIFAVIIALYMRHDFCHNQKYRLQDLFFKTQGALDKTGEPWFIDYGTLLGAVRDQGLLEHEYDLDIGLIGEDTCERIYAKKHFFEEAGLTLYNRHDYIRSKNTLKYDTHKKSFYWSDAYIHAPCMRAYHSTGYFADIYAYTEYSADQVRHRVNVEKNYTILPHEDIDGNPYDVNTTTYSLMCNAHGLLEEDKEGGGCQIKNTILPTGTMELLGKTVAIPHSPKTHLQEIYTKTWVTPTTKGIRGPLCYFHM